MPSPCGSRSSIGSFFILCSPFRYCQGAPPLTVAETMTSRSFGCPFRYCQGALPNTTHKPNIRRVLLVFRSVYGCFHMHVLRGMYPHQSIPGIYKIHASLLKAYGGAGISSLSINLRGCGGRRPPRLYFRTIRSTHISIYSIEQLFNNYLSK